MRVKVSLESRDLEKTIKVIVTCGAGFLGSHLTEKLLRESHEVSCLDNFHTESKENINHLLSNPSFELLLCDITFPLYVEVDPIYIFSVPYLSRPLSKRSSSNYKNDGSRCIQYVIYNNPP